MYTHTYKNHQYPNTISIHARRYYSMVYPHAFVAKSPPCGKYTRDGWYGKRCGTNKIH